MQTRIFGLENEYGLISSSLGGKLNLSVESALGYLFEKVVSRQRGTNDFLRNGARLYQDTGCHPEYATPECDNPLDLVIHDKAGERIVEELLYAAGRKLRENGVYCEIYIFKNNTDSVGKKYCWHRDLPGGAIGQLPQTGRAPDSLFCHPPGLRGGGQGPADQGGEPLLHLPAGAAHLPGDLGGYHELPRHHQHP